MTDLPKAEWRDPGPKDWQNEIMNDLKYTQVTFKTEELDGLEAVTCDCSVADKCPRGYPPMLTFRINLYYTLLAFLFWYGDRVEYLRIQLQAIIVDLERRANRVESKP